MSKKDLPSKNKYRETFSKNHLTQDSRTVYLKYEYHIEICCDFERAKPDYHYIKIGIYDTARRTHIRETIIINSHLSYEIKTSIKSTVKNKCAVYEDVKHFAELIYLLNLKYDYDRLIRGYNSDNAGFLHTCEISKLNDVEKKTRVGKSLYVTLGKFIVSNQKDKAWKLLNDVFVNPDQLYHLICYIGVSTLREREKEEAQLLWWLNISKDDNICLRYLNGDNIDRSSESYKRLLSGMFSCLDDELESLPELIKNAEDKIGTLNGTETNVGKNTIKTFKHHLKAIAEAHLQEKLHGKACIKFRLEIGEYDNENITSMNSIRPGNERERRWKDLTCEDLEDINGINVLSSDAGCGKTTLLRTLQVDIIERTDYIPLYLEAAEIVKWTFDKYDYMSFKDKLSEYYKAIIEKDKMGDLLDSHKDKLYFIIDGLDQIEGVGSEYANLVNRIISLFPDKGEKRIIIASRPFALSAIETNAQTSLLRLKKFNDSDLLAYFGCNYDIAKKLCQRCMELLCVPMLAYMVRYLIENNETESLSNRTDIYRRYVNYILNNSNLRYRHDNLKISDQTKRGILRVLSEISYNAIAQERPLFQAIPFDIVDRCSKDNGIVTDELFKLGMINQLGNNIYFCHQSFQEYLAAVYIALDDSLIDKVLLEKWNPKWEETLKFLTGIKGQVIIDKILAEKDNIIHAKTFQAAKFVLETDVTKVFKGEIISKVEALLCIPFFSDDALGCLAYIDYDKAMDSLKYLIMNDNDCLGIPSIIQQLNVTIRDDITEILADKLSYNNCENVDVLLFIMAKLKIKINQYIISKIIDVIPFAHYLSFHEIACILRKGNGDSINSIVKLLGSVNYQIRDEALSIINELKDRINEDSLKIIISYISNDDDDIVESAISALEIINYNVSDTIIETIIGLLEKNNAQIILSVSSILAKAEIKYRKRASLVIMNYMECSSLIILQALIRGIGILNISLDNKILNKIANYLHHESGGIVLESLKILSAQKENINTQIIIEIIKCLERAEPNVIEETINIILSSEELITEKVYLVLISTIKNNNSRVKGIIKKVLLRINDDTVLKKRLLDILISMNHEIAANSINSINKYIYKEDNNNLANVISLLQSEDEEIVITSIDTLCSLGINIDNECLENLIRLCDSDNPRIVLKAAEYLKDKKYNINEYVLNNMTWAYDVNSIYKVINGVEVLIDMNMSIDVRIIKKMIEVFIEMDESAQITIMHAIIDNKTSLRKDDIECVINILKKCPNESVKYLLDILIGLVENLDEDMINKLAMQFKMLTEKAITPQMLGFQFIKKSLNDYHETLLQYSRYKELWLLLYQNGKLESLAV